LKEKYINAHMQAAEVYAKLSTAKRLQVGCVVVKDNTIIGIGYNGMPSGWTNECEEKIYTSPWRSEHDEMEEMVYSLKTKPEVLHAETNALAKVARSTNSSEGASLFVTHSPCIECAKLVYQSGINSVYYRSNYGNDDGINFLIKAGVEVKKV
jgi:dCMP deaminase